MKGCSEETSGSCKTDLVRSPLRFLLWYLPIAVALLGWFVEPWRWPLWAASFLWMGAGCSVNAKGCGRVHPPNQSCPDALNEPEAQDLFHVNVARIKRVNPESPILIAV